MKVISLLLSLLVVFLVGCSKDQTIPGDHGGESALQNKTFFEEVGQLQPVNPYAPYVKAMQECVYADSAEKSCAISKLPLLGLLGRPITVNDVLNRTLYSHQFLANAFREVLLRMNPEVLQMFGSVNAIVLSDKINPSFYLTSSGAIYLSGSFFWANLQEYKIVSQAKDERAAFGSALQFTTDHDYIKNKRSIWYRSNETTRTYDEMVMPVVRLLFHELTHANDYFPRNVYASASFDSSQTYQKIAFDRYVSEALVSNKQPTQLESSKLWHLGDVLFHGKSPSVEDKNTLAVEVASEFKQEKATDMYSFSALREDLAMNAEEALMLYYYDASRYVVIIKYPYSNFVPPEDYTYPIVWGQKGRVLVPEIKERALYAVENDLGADIRYKAESKFRYLSPVEIPANTPWDNIVNL